MSMAPEITRSCVIRNTNPVSGSANPADIITGRTLMSALLQTSAAARYAPAPGFRYHIELINGQEIEKPTQKKLHTWIQVHLIAMLGKLLPEGFEPLSEQDVLTGERTADGRRGWICPDVQVAPKKAKYEDGMLAEPPLWAVEIMSPGQPLPQLFTRAERLLAIGCPTVWVIWPEKRRAWEYSAEDLIECQGKLTGCLPAGADSQYVSVDLAEMWKVLDRPE